MGTVTVELHEAALGIAARPARHGGLGLVDTIESLKNEHLHSHVLSLPVSTQIAQVRGHDGYGFPKWVTGLDVDIDGHGVSARVANDLGATDLALVAATPKQTRRQSGAAVAALTSYTTIGDAWHSTFSQTNLLAAGTKRFPSDVRLELGGGRMSEDVRSLEPLKTLQVDVVTESQLALHMPVPVSVATR